MAKKDKKDINYELRYKEIQKAFNQLCFTFREEQMKNYSLLNFVIVISGYADPSEMKPKELKEFASYVYTKAHKLHEMFIGKPMARWSWEKEKNKESEDE